MNITDLQDGFVELTTAMLPELKRKGYKYVALGQPTPLPETDTRRDYDDELGFVEVICIPYRNEPMNEPVCHSIDSEDISVILQYPIYYKVESRYL